MAFDPDLALRVREGLLTVSGALPDEKRMFGGLCFMIAADTVADDAALQDWLSLCFAFVRTLPPK